MVRVAMVVIRIAIVAVPVLMAGVAALRLVGMMRVAVHAGHRQVNGVYAARVPQLA